MGMGSLRSYGTPHSPPESNDGNKALHVCQGDGGQGYHNTTNNKQTHPTHKVSTTIHTSALKDHRHIVLFGKFWDRVFPHIKFSR